MFECQSANAPVQQLLMYIIREVKEAMGRCVGLTCAGADIQSILDILGERCCMKSFFEQQEHGVVKDIEDLICLLVIWSPWIRGLRLA